MIFRVPEKFWWLHPFWEGQLSSNGGALRQRSHTKSSLRCSQAEHAEQADRTVE